MLSSINTLWILAPAFLIITVILLINRRRINQDPHIVKRSFRLLKLYLISIGSFTAITWLVVSSFPAILTTFGYPDTVESIQTTEQILDYLQQYNRALTTTMNAFSLFLFAFTVWLLSSIYEFAKTITHALIEKQSRL